MKRGRLTEPEAPLDGNAEVPSGIGETKCAVANFAWFATGSARLTSNSTQTLRPVATSCPRESFSGHQLMCIMFAGFKRIAPEQDSSMDLNEPWITALELFHVGKRSEGS